MNGFLIKEQVKPPNAGECGMKKNKNKGVILSTEN